MLEKMLQAYKKHQNPDSDDSNSESEEEVKEEEYSGDKGYMKAPHLSDDEKLESTIDEVREAEEKRNIEDDEKSTDEEVALFVASDSENEETTSIYDDDEAMDLSIQKPREEPRDDNPRGEPRGKNPCDENEDSVAEDSGAGNILRDLLSLRNNDQSTYLTPAPRVRHPRSALTPSADVINVRRDVTNVHCDVMDASDVVRIKEEASDDQPCVMNTSEDARTFWDEVACVMNSEPRLEKLVPMAEVVAGSRRLAIVTEHLNNFLTRVDKVRRVGPEFISKFVLMFNGFVNLWRKDNGLPPLINLDDDCLNVSSRKFGLDGSVTQRAAQAKSYNMATGNTMKILPKSEISQRREAPKRSLDGQIRCQSSPALPLLKPKLVPRTSAGSALSGVQATSGTVTMTSPSVSGAFTQVSGSTVQPSGPVPVSQIFIRLPNGQLSPQGQLIVDATKIRHGVNPVTSQPVMRQNIAPNLVTQATAQPKHVVNIPSVKFFNQPLPGFDPNAGLVLPQPTSVMTSFPVSRESPSPARKLARIAPAPSRESSSPVSPFRGQNNELEKTQNQGEGEVFEAVVCVLRNFEADSFETNVTVDKANGQGCISDINKKCAKGEVSLRDILKLGNFKNVKFEDLVLSFDQTSTQSNVKLNLKFKQS